MPTHWLLKNLSPPHFLSFLRMEAIFYPPTKTFLVLPRAFIPHERTTVEALKLPCGRIAIYDRFDGILCCKLIIHSELKRMVFWLKLNERNTRSEYIQKILLGWSHYFLRRISARNEKNLFCPETVPRYNALKKDFEEEELRNILNE